ncbi:POTRA domain-containing protein [Nitrospira sp. Kam-Ns4a]
MGFFEDVQVETEPAPGGVAVTFVIREKLFITEIVFDGNEELSDDKLKEKITIRSQSFLDQQQAKESAEKIRLQYQEDGYYNAQVIPIIQALDQDRKRLTFYISVHCKRRAEFAVPMRLARRPRRNLKNVHPSSPPTRAARLRRAR